MVTRQRFWRTGPVAVVLLTFLALASPAVAADRGGMIHVIVNFRGPQTLLPAQTRHNTQTVKDSGGRVTRSFKLINSAAATIPAGRLKHLESQPNVKSVEPDAKITAMDAELDASWGVKHIGAGDVHTAGNTGQGVKVGIIDTGIDYTHPELAAAYAGGYDFFNNDADPFDDNGHGTHVAGIIAAQQNGTGVVGVAPGVQLYSYKVLGADGSGDYSGLIAALERASTVDHVQVINMSLGGSEVSQALADEVAGGLCARRDHGRRLRQREPERLHAADLRLPGGLSRRLSAGLCNDLHEPERRADRFLVHRPGGGLRVTR